MGKERKTTQVCTSRDTWSNVKQRTCGFQGIFGLVFLCILETGCLLFHSEEVTAISDRIAAASSVPFVLFFSSDCVGRYFQLSFCSFLAQFSPPDGQERPLSNIFVPLIFAQPKTGLIIVMILLLPLDMIATSNHELFNQGSFCQ